MNTTTINIKIDAKTKAEAQRLAKELGFSLSAIMKGYLREFVRTKEINLRLEEPSDYLKKSIAEADEDLKHGRTLTFNSWEEEEAYLKSIIAKDEGKRKKD